MSSRTDVQVASPFQRLVGHLQSPLYRNGYFLILSSLSTSAIGFVYWIIAAHIYPTTVVGINSAVVAAMTFIAGISELNLMSALIRFIPTSGKATRRFVVLSYLVTIAISVLVCFVFIKNTSMTPALKFLGSNSLLAVVFIISTMTWTVFVLQDSVLTGLRQTSWVPVENILFSLIKIAVMIVLARITPEFGIFGSWSVALIIAILPTNYFIFRSLIPKHIQQNSTIQTQIGSGGIIRFVAADYIGALAWIICTTLMPVIVTTVAGATENAYFYLSWTIANALYLIGPGMGSSLVVEAVKNQEKLIEYSRRTFFNSIKIVIAAASFVVIGAPFILMVFGRNYSTSATTLLRLLALSAIPNTINSIYISIRRVQRRMKEVVKVLVSLCSLVLVFSYSLLKKYGIEGVGFGWLISQVIISGYVLWIYLRSESTIRRLNVENQDRSINRTNTDMLLINYLYPLTRKFQIYPILTAAKKTWSGWKIQGSAALILPKIIKDIPAKVYRPSQGVWKIHFMMKSETNTTIAFLGPGKRQPHVVIKLPGSTKETETLIRQGENLRLLFKERNLQEWRSLLPATIYSGEVDGQVYFIERAMPGIKMLTLLQNPEKRELVINLAADTIGNLHKGTAHSINLADNSIEQWVQAPLEKVTRYLSGCALFNGYQKSLNNLSSHLREQLLGRQVTVSWIHGDYTPSNILVDPEGTRVTGIVDWDLAAPDEYPLLDLMHLFLSIRREKTRSEIGQIVADLFVHKDWMPYEIQLLQNAESSLHHKPLDLQVLLLMCWLRHIKGNLDKTSRFDHHNLWASENIVRVLSVCESAS